MATIAERQEAATVKLESAAETMDGVKNGGPTVTLPVNGGSVPSLRKWFADLDQQVTGITGALPRIAEAEHDIEAIQNGNVSADSMVALLSLDTTKLLNGQVVRLNGFYPSSGVTSASGSGLFKWEPAAPHSAHNGFTIISPTVPFSGSSNNLMNFLRGVGETSPSGFGCFVRIFDGPVLIEWAGANGSFDTSLVFQHVIDKLLLTNTSVVAPNEYVLGSPIVMHAYRTPSAPVYKDFNRVSVTINKATYTATSGTAISVSSPVARLEVKRLIGPGTAAGNTQGVMVSGFGDPGHKIGWVTGFTNDVNLNTAFGHTIECGWWSGDCVRGVFFQNANANKIYGGRIGGGFSSSAFDPESPEVGVAISADCANNEIHSNIEYCRRSPTAVGINDQGAGTRFIGYTESCASYCILANGKDGHFTVLAGGTNVLEEQAGYYANDTNVIELLTQIDYANELTDGANATLAYIFNQGFGFGNSGKLKGPRGWKSFSGYPSIYQNEVLDGSQLYSGIWSSDALGGASWADVSVGASAVAMPHHGLSQSTRMVFPARAEADKIYRKSQSGINLPTGPSSFGVFVFCEAGEVDVMLRVITSNGRQSRTSAKVLAGTGFLRVGCDYTNSSASNANATYEISFRSVTGGTIYVMDCWSVNAPSVNIPVVNVGGIRRKSLPGAEVEGTAFYNGVKINGSLYQCPSPLVKAPFTISTGSIEYPVYLIDSFVGNIFLEPGFDGQVLVLKRIGSAASSGCNLLASGTTIDGVSSKSLAAPYTLIKLIYSAAAGEWLSL